MRVLLGGGRTGGHLYPALAILEALRAIEPGTQRARYDLGPDSYSGPTLTPGQSAMRAADVLELRQALLEVYAAAMRAAPSFTTSPTAGGPIQAADIADLRRAVAALE